MTGDHVFVDSLGQTVRGREAVRKGRQGYFAFCPDYWSRTKKSSRTGIRPLFSAPPAAPSQARNGG